MDTAKREKEYSGTFLGEREFGNGNRRSQGQKSRDTKANRRVRKKKRDPEFLIGGERVP